MVGTHAGDMIGEIALAIEMGADAVDIGKTIHPHPTLGESIGMAAEVAHGSYGCAACAQVSPQPSTPGVELATVRALCFAYPNNRRRILCICTVFMPATSNPKLYNPRHPERTLLYQTVAEHHETWLELASAGQFDSQGDHHPKPFVRKAFAKVS